MKMLAFSFLFLSSFTAQAAILEWSSMSEVLENGPGPVSGELAAKIKQALTTELQKSAYDCQWNVKNGPSNAGIGGELISVLNEKTAQIFVSPELNQPVIRVVHRYSDGSVEVSILFSTTPDFKKLTKIEASKDNLSQVTKNTGTLIDPKFETVIERTPKLFGSCSVK
jgi:hypothetical protein